MPWQPITTPGQLVAQLSGRTESSACDLKVTYDFAEPGTRAELAKDIAAFASAFGGTIIVGAKERDGRIVRLPGVGEPGKLTRELTVALASYCAPVPSTPEDLVLTLSRDSATTLVPESEAPTGDVQLVVLNVQPDARGPIGVRVLEGKAPSRDSYRFPVRLTDQTIFLDPTELSMWMNSHERRVALQLRKIGASATKPGRITLHCRSGSVQQAPYERTVDLVGVDEVGMFAVIEDDSIKLRTHVPFGFIAAVWQLEDGTWALAARGSVIAGGNFTQQSKGSRFVPYLGGG